MSGVSNSVIYSTNNDEATRQLTNGPNLDLIVDQFGDYDVINGEITITSCFGQSATSTFQIELTDVTEAPELEIKRPTRTIKQSKKVNFQLAPSASDCSGT